MKFQGAVIKEQGISFAIVAVRMTTMQNPDQREKTVALYTGIFQGIPVVLTAKDFKGALKYFGRSDIVAYLSKIKPGSIPWKEYTYS